jgi:hypothetical protein
MSEDSEKLTNGSDRPLYNEKTFGRGDTEKALAIHVADGDRVAKQLTDRGWSHPRRRCGRPRLERMCLVVEPDGLGGRLSAVFEFVPVGKVALRPLHAQLGVFKMLSQSHAVPHSGP